MSKSTRYIVCFTPSLITFLRLSLNIQIHKNMENKDYSIYIDVNIGAAKAYDCILAVSKWWTDNIQGNTQELNDEFTVEFWDLHRSTQKIVELIPHKKIEWLITDSRLSFIKDTQEWTGTKVVFDIEEHENGCRIRFSHIGLNPEVECYTDCSRAWGQYIQESLFHLISTGQGNPTLFLTTDS